MDIWSRPERASLGIGMIKGKFPRVILTPEASARMEALVQCCNIEISWLATVDREGNDFLIDNVLVPPQVCSFGGTVFGEANMMSMFMGADGKLPREVLPVINKLRAWGHSHHTMAVFASSVDEKQSNDFLEQIPDYFVRLICNKGGDINVTLYLLDRDLVLYHPKVICRQFKKADRTELFANEMYPFDDWAMGEIDKKVTRQYERMHVDDFADDEEAEDVLLQLGRTHPLDRLIG